MADVDHPAPKPRPVSDDAPGAGLSEDERESLDVAITSAINYHSFDAMAEMSDFDMADAIVDTTSAASAPGGLVAAVETILTARLAAAEAAHARDLAALAYLGKVDSSGRPSNDRDGSCTCDYNPETTDGPVEDCPFHGRPYAYWMERGDRLAERAEVAEGAVVRANAVLNSYGIRGQLWHDLNAILTPAIAALATPPGRSGTADPEART